jgi:hypothetical protein
VICNIAITVSGGGRIGKLNIFVALCSPSPYRYSPRRTVSPAITVIGSAAEAADHVGNILKARLLQKTRRGVGARSSLASNDNLFVVRKVRFHDFDEVRVHHHAACRIGKGDGNIDRALRVTIGELALRTYVNVNDLNVENVVNLLRPLIAMYTSLEWWSTGMMEYC